LRHETVPRDRPTGGTVECIAYPNCRPARRNRGSIDRVKQVRDAKRSPDGQAGEPLGNVGADHRDAGPMDPLRDITLPSFG
jgi:hypothetical protein